MILSYAQLEQTLSAHLRIQPDKVPTFRARVKQLQRLEFPSGINVGRGVRMDYSAEHLLKLALAFELLDSGLPAQPACNLVEDHWAIWAAGFALAALADRHGHPEPDEGRLRVFAVAKVSNLHEIQFHPYKQTKPSEVTVCDRGWLRIKLEGDHGINPLSHLVLAQDRLLANVLEAASNVAGVTGAGTWSNDFHDWLPKGKMRGINFAGYYPDRSNLEMRREINQFSGEDPSVGSPEDLDMINQFIRNGYKFDRF